MFRRNPTGAKGARNAEFTSVLGALKRMAAAHKPASAKRLVAVRRVECRTRAPINSDKFESGQTPTTPRRGTCRGTGGWGHLRASVLVLIADNGGCVRRNGLKPCQQVDDGALE
jgi:hypothetical protein